MSGKAKMQAHLQHGYISEHIINNCIFDNRVHR